MNLKKHLLFFLVIISVSFFYSCIQPQDTADYYVSPAGSDANPGSKTQPFATIQKAQKSIRKKIAGGLTRNLRVMLQNGVYRLEKPLIFGPGDSGTDDFSITYAAYPGEKPVISGGKLISGWRRQEDGTWQTTIPEVKAGKWRFRELFVNGKRAVRARQPNRGFNRLREPGKDRRTSFFFHPGEIENWDDLKSVELIYTHDWAISRVRLDSVNLDSNLAFLAFPVGASGRNYWKMWKGERFYLENSLHFLDAPGEWHLDTATGVLRYKPLPGEKPENTNVTAPVVTQLLRIQGDTENQHPIKNLHFDGLIFEYCAYHIPESGYAGIQAAFHRRGADPALTERNVMPPAVLFELSEKCSVTNGEIRHTGGTAIWFGRQCRENLLEGNHIFNISGNGVMIGEPGDRQVEGASWWQKAPAEVASGNSVKNNRIEQCGQQYFGSVGVWIGLAQNTTISHNEIASLPYTGVSLGWMWNPTPTPCKENVVEKNHIHHVMQILSDGAGIYTLGLQPGSVLRENHIHDVPLNAGRAESNGMFLDEGSTDFVVENNLIYNIEKSPIRFHRATTNTVRNNFLGVRPGTPPIRYNRTNEADIKKINNTILQDSDLLLQTDPGVKRIKQNAGPEKAFVEKWRAK